VDGNLEKSIAGPVISRVGDKCPEPDNSQHGVCTLQACEWILKSISSEKLKVGI